MYRDISNIVPTERQESLVKPIQLLKNIMNERDSFGFQTSRFVAYKQGSNRPTENVATQSPTYLTVQLTVARWITRLIFFMPTTPHIKAFSNAVKDGNDTPRNFSTNDCEAPSEAIKHELQSQLCADNFQKIPIKTNRKKVTADEGDFWTEHIRKEVHHFDANVFISPTGVLQENALCVERAASGTRHNFRKFSSVV
ncbi:hypothetical protein T265_05661 [Opisthorchis viverrini]|uniref:Uncharacterized protein n=1 Tax=Opisthorchis viverrini TaxID=6198 RepID=A0A074ZNC9_OPIVI|nr:hypothetical protein T265_05661 [Opisthorchis viverrini]KER27257.1 hypothetical protein T265_05661 [Opisthorchis viverrini]